MTLRPVTQTAEVAVNNAFTNDKWVCDSVAIGKLSSSAPIKIMAKNPNNSI